MMRQRKSTRVCVSGEFVPMFAYLIADLVTVLPYLSLSLPCDNRHVSFFSLFHTRLTHSPKPLGMSLLPSDRCTYRRTFQNSPSSTTTIIRRGRQRQSQLYIRKYPPSGDSLVFTLNGFVKGVGALVRVLVSGPCKSRARTSAASVTASPHTVRQTRIEKGK